MRTREEIKKVLDEILREIFSEACIDISDGYGDRNIHVKVFSKQFDGMSETHKYDWVWTHLNRSPKISEDEMLSISLLEMMDSTDLEEFTASFLSKPPAERKAIYGFTGMPPKTPLAV